MERFMISQKLWMLLKKYKYVLLVLAVGLVLMFAPDTKNDSQSVEPSQLLIESTEDTETRLKNILAQIAGAGRVEVLLTEAYGKKTVYQLDTDVSGDRSSNDTVIISGAERSEDGLVTQVNPPQYLGAVIVCEGADDPNVCLCIVSATSKATGLGADKISVLKMK